MMKLAIIGASIFTAITISLVVVTLTDAKPRLDIVVAAKVFDRYPHWQRSVLPSQEVALDPGLARTHAAKFDAPSSFGNDPFDLWQPARRMDVNMEFGVGRVAKQVREAD